MPQEPQAFVLAEDAHHDRQVRALQFLGDRAAQGEPERTALESGFLLHRLGDLRKGFAAQLVGGFGVAHKRLQHGLGILLPEQFDHLRVCEFRGFLQEKRQAFGDVLKRHQPILHRRSDVLQQARVCLRVGGLGDEGAQPLEEVVRSQRLEVLLVHPVELVPVKHRSGAVDALKIERLHQFGQREKLLIVCRTPAQQGDEIHHCFRQIALITKVLNRHVALTFAEFGSIRIEDERQVRKLRRLPAQVAVEQQMLRERRQPLLAPHAVGDAHVMIVHDDRKVVGRKAIALDDHLILGLRGFNHHLSAHEIVQHQRFRSLRHLHADDVSLA